MFFIVGVDSKVRELRMLTMVCWQCERAAAHRLSEVKHRFTLFFLPLFPVKTRRRLQCLLCGADQELTSEQVEQILNLPAESSRPSPTGGAGAD